MFLTGYREQDGESENQYVSLQEVRKHLHGKKIVLTNVRGYPKALEYSVRGKRSYAPKRVDSKEDIAEEQSII